METLVFLVGAVLVMLFLARDRIGGRSRTPDEQSDFDSHRPVGYGANVAPPGTARGASVQAPYLGSEQSGGSARSHGADE